MADEYPRSPDKIRKPDGSGSATEQTSFETVSQDWTNRLISVQDMERRRIARELHDSLGQKVIVLKMSLDRLNSSPNLSAEDAALVAQSASVIEALSKEVRTMSYLLHPPLLDELGLASALRELLDGLSQRSGIQTSLEVHDGFGRLPADVEISIYRIAQECLTNIYRHSDASAASIRIQPSRAGIDVEVQDNGKGIAANAIKAGVGLNGMRERAAELGGALEINSNGRGTTVIAHLPTRK